MISILRSALVFSVIGMSACADDVYPERPEVEPAIYGTIFSDPSLHSFVTATMIASESNDLIDQLSNDGSYTVFVPSNAAFDRLAIELTGDPAATSVDVLVEENQPLLRDVLHYHVVAGELASAVLPRDTPIATLGGNELTVATGSPMVIVDARDRVATVTTPDLTARNGVIHVIDAVLLPPE